MQWIAKTGTARHWQGAMAGSSGKMAAAARDAAGAGLIVALWWAGETGAALLPVPAPGAVIGLMLMLPLLRARVVAALVARPAAWITGLLGALIVPAAVALGDGVPGMTAVVVAKVAAVLALTTLATGIATALLWRTLSR